MKSISFILLGIKILAQHINLSSELSVRVGGHGLEGESGLPPSGIKYREDVAYVRCGPCGCPPRSAGLGSGSLLGTTPARDSTPTLTTLGLHHYLRPSQGQGPLAHSQHVARSGSRSSCRAPARV